MFAKCPQITRALLAALNCAAIAVLVLAAPTDAASQYRQRPGGAPVSTADPLPAVGDQPQPHTDPHHKEPPQMSPLARPVPAESAGFGPDPIYPEDAYDPGAQRAIYGGKSAVDKVRPLIEFGQPLYGEGPLGPTYNLIGAKNLLMPQLYAYGDWRTVVAFNDGGARELGQAATRINLDVDLKLTATERVHALFRPLDRKGDFTRYEFGGNDRNDADPEHLRLNHIPETLFFEGDLGAIVSGLRDEYTSWDLPFTFGLVPIFLQNGVWLDDAFLGGAVTIPARNSRILDISNLDVTFFAGGDKVSTTAIRDDRGQIDEGAARLFGITAFLETMEGYVEAGYGYVQDSRPDEHFDYNNATVAFTRRYGGMLSNSLRLIYNWGQDPGAGRRQTADGFALLVENSLVTPLPYTLVPYANFFWGNDRPQSLARDPGAGGILKNVGINFETDNLTGFPKLDDTANDTFGGAMGVQYLFNLDQQFILEAATVQVIGTENAPNRAAKGDQYAIGVRYQIPVTNAWIFRADGILGWLDDSRDIHGLRVEMRRKF